MGPDGLVEIEVIGEEVSLMLLTEALSLGGTFTLVDFSTLVVLAFWVIFLPWDILSAFEALGHLLAMWVVSPQ